VVAALVIQRMERTVARRLGSERLFSFGDGTVNGADKRDLGDRGNGERADSAELMVARASNGRTGVYRLFAGWVLVHVQ